MSPLNPFRAVEYFSTVFEKPWRELFAGQLIPVDDMPRSYVPTLFALQVPELMLLLGLCGLAGVLIFIVRSAGNSGAGAGRRAAFLSVALAATLPIVIAVMTRPVVYNVIRHIVSCCRHSPVWATSPHVDLAAECWLGPASSSRLPGGCSDVVDMWACFVSSVDQVTARLGVCSMLRTGAEVVLRVSECRVDVR